jgi:hypothetical protein
MLGAASGWKETPMRPYSVIDADSHVEEPVETWEYLAPRYRTRRPFPIVGEGRADLFGVNALWYQDHDAVIPHGDDLGQLPLLGLRREVDLALEARILRSAPDERGGLPAFLGTFEGG